MQITLLRVRALLLFVALISFQGSIAQNQTNNYGKEFRFAFLENYGAFEKVSFVISCEQRFDTVTISCGSWNSGKIPVYSKDTIIEFLKAGTPSASVFSPTRSIYITSHYPISLQAMNNSLNSTDITTIIPIERTPYNPIYYVNTYRGDESIGKANNSLFSVVALDDSVQINILPTCNSKNNLVQGVVYTKILRKGQVYQEQALDSQTFAGTKIWNSKGCKKFSVFEGAKCSFVEYNNSSCKGCDHLYNQSLPIQYLGTSFTTIPFGGNFNGYMYQIVATANNTQISINGIPSVVLNEGQSHLVNQKTNTSVCISSDKMISVVELMKSGECNGQNSNLGNPSMMSLIPDNQLTMQAGFSFPTTSNISLNPSFPAEYYVAIVGVPGHLGSIRLNGVKLDTAKFNSACNMAIGTFKLNGNTRNHLSSTHGFIAYMYAQGKDESYASPVGLSFENRVSELIVESNTTSVCDTLHEFKFKAESDSAANYHWTFSDGSSNTGAVVSKSFNKSGSFSIKLTIDYVSNNGCQSDTIEKTVKINSQPVFDLGKDTQFCMGAFYELAPIVRPRSSFSWWNGSTAPLVLINNNTKASLTITDTNMCRFSDTIMIRFVNCDTSSIVIPNVFTPGKDNLGDNINDLFESEFSGFDYLQGVIYNRWGVPVYQFDYPNKGFWNGGQDNDFSNPCPAGTYYYMYKFTNSKTGLTKDINGVVELIR